MTKKLHITQDYALRRQREYPPVGDALDAIQKALQALQASGAVSLPPDANAWLEACRAVKTSIPKKPKGP